MFKRIIDYFKEKPSRIFFVLFTAAALVFASALFKQCTPGETIAKQAPPKPNPVIVARVNTAEIELAACRKRVDSLLAVAKEKEKRAILADNDARKWKAKYEKAVAAKDTGATLTACAEAPAVIDSLTGVITDQKETIKGLQVMHEAERAATDSVTAAQADFVSAWRIQAENAVSERNAIADKFNSQNKKLRRTERWLKVVGTIGAALLINQGAQAIFK